MYATLAYVMPCRSATEQKRMLARILEEMDALDVAPDILDPALAAALAEGHALGEPPAHGLVDVAEVCGIQALRPAPMSVRDWIAGLDPDGNPDNHLRVWQAPHQPVQGRARLDADRGSRFNAD